MDAVACMSYAFGANFTLVCLIAQTFEFWFKILNVIAWDIAAYMVYINGSAPFLVVIIGIVTQTCLFLTLFIFDAIMISPIKVKYIFVCIIGFFHISMLIFVYFAFGGDVYYNPFKSFGIEQTSINFKSLFVTSTANIVLFILKPVFIYLSSNLVARLNGKCGCCGDCATCIMDNNTSGQDALSYSAMIHKRAQLRWRNQVNNCNYNTNVQSINFDIPLLPMS